MAQARLVKTPKEEKTITHGLVVLSRVCLGIGIFVAVVSTVCAIAAIVDMQRPGPGSMLSVGLVWIFTPIYGILAIIGVPLCLCAIIRNIYLLKTGYITSRLASTRGGISLLLLALPLIYLAIGQLIWQLSR